MRFAAEIWLFGVLLSALLGLILLFQGLQRSRALARFGDDERVSALLTARPTVRRTVRGVLSCLAIGLAFVAAAQPQFGKGTRILPATNLDLVLVLDFSKSMYARDVSPSRIGRAKVEVSRLIRELAGARFAAVAFAGESISFPLTSDGSAISQFFRGLEPNDLPIGGTAIARALESGRQLLARDPLAKNHERALILVTDGEDLEGDPVATAKAARADGIRVYVVQVGGQSPEPIPEVDENGVSGALRKDAQGKVLTTELTPEGEAQLRGIADEGGGSLVRAAQGEVGLDELTATLRKFMNEELSERVETVFADVYHYPLALALVLLMIEAWIGAAAKRITLPEPPKGHSKRRRPRRLHGAAALFCLLSLGCDKVDQVFSRESPEVNKAISALLAKDADESAKLLVKYLETGPCEAGVIGAGDLARKRGDATYDLALAFAQLSSSQQKGAPSSAPPQAPPNIATPPGAGPPGVPEDSAQASQWLDCGLTLLVPVSANATFAPELRARAHYLAGNLQMLKGQYKDAVLAYDAALLLAPGVDTEDLKTNGALKGLLVDPLGISIAYNRALALRLQKEEEEKKKAEEEQKEQGDESKDDEPKDEQSKDDEPKDDEPKDDEPKDGEPKDGEPKGDEPKDDEPKEPQESAKNEPGDKDPSQPQPPEPTEAGEPEPTAGDAKRSPSQSRDQMMLDQLEQAPTLQQHDAERRKNQGGRYRSTMEDK